MNAEMSRFLRTDSISIKNLKMDGDVFHAIRQQSAAFLI